MSSISISTLPSIIPRPNCAKYVVGCLHFNYVLYNNENVLSIEETDRHVESRQLSLSQRNAQPDEMDEFDANDKLPKDWRDLLTCLPHHPSVTNNSLAVVIQESGVVLLSLSESQNISLSIAITKDWKIIAKTSSTEVSCRDLLGYQTTLSRWSQLEAVIHRVRQADPDPRKEQAVLLSRYQEIGLDPKKEFLVEQLQLADVSPNGRRYSPQMLLHALRLYLASKSGYREMRSTMTLPHPKTLKKGLGPLHTTGGLEDCEEMVNICFNDLSNAQRDCIIIFDEVYVKPSLRFRGGHVFGEAADQPGCLATTILAILVKPLMGGPAFIARLIPIRVLNKDFLYDQLDTVVGIINKFGGVVRATVCDNHFVNKQLYAKMSAACADDKPFIGRTSTQEKIYLLYDSTHLLKNVRNNWLNEALQLLGIVDPETGKF